MINDQSNPLAATSLPLPSCFWAFRALFIAWINSILSFIPFEKACFNRRWNYGFFLFLLDLASFTRAGVVILGAKFVLLLSYSLLLIASCHRAVILNSRQSDLRLLVDAFRLLIHNNWGLFFRKLSSRGLLLLIWRLFFLIILIVLFKSLMIYSNNVPCLLENGSSWFHHRGFFRHF